MSRRIRKRVHQAHPPLFLGCWNKTGRRAAEVKVQDLGQTRSLSLSRMIRVQGFSRVFPRGKRDSIYFFLPGEEETRILKVSPGLAAPLPFFPPSPLFQPKIGCKEKSYGPSGLSSSPPFFGHFLFFFSSPGCEPSRGDGKITLPLFCIRPPSAI